MHTVFSAPAARYRIAAHGRGMMAVVLLGAALAASPALAQDATFTGFKIEAITGYDNEGVDFDDDFFTGGKNSQSGWMYGVGIGYDYQFGAGVVGIEGEWSDSTASRDEDFSGIRPDSPTTGVPAAPVTAHLESKAGADLYIGLRAGYVVNPQLLLYLKGGYTHQRIELDGNGTDNAVPFDFDEKVKVDGFRLGVGGEYQFGSGWYGKAEYRYTNYNNGDLDIRGADVDLDPLFHGIDVVRHQFILGAGFRF